MASNFPKLPGYVVTHDPTITNHKRISQVHLEKVRNHKDIAVPLHCVPRPPVANFAATKSEASKSFSHSQFPNHYGADQQEHFEPVFVKLDKQVLRFYGYSKEHVVESRLENSRVRNLVIYYYLEDKSIMVQEPKQQDSGVPQGAFLKRHQVIKASGHPYMPDDFCVGGDIGLYGRQIRLTDADQYTREFYENAGRPLAPGMGAPVDAFSKSKVPIPPKKDPDMLSYLEKKLGGGRPAPQKQFLDNDRKVLNFNCMCEVRPFILNYYLADDTIEVREVHHQNDGHDNFACLLRRRKLPEHCEVKQPGQAFIGDNYLTCDEIFFDKPIDVYGHTMTIVGVDQYTQDFYNQKYGRHFPLGKHEAAAPRTVKPPQVPPHNPLMGQEEDSLGYIYKLMPHRPKGNFFKKLDNSAKILRFTARFNTRVPEDVDRRFIIAFYLSDDGISIYEPEQKNSGIISGAFLKKRKYKNVDNNGEWVTPSDMALGGDVKINGHSFRILSCDEYTQKYLTEHLYD